MVRDDSQVDPYSETAASVEQREQGGSAGGAADPASATALARPGGRAPPAPDRTATDAGRNRPPEPEGDDLTGARLAHFRVDRLLGKGGMGAVYLATDLALDRPVALKFLPREIARDPALKERFYREARAQARIAHPNVCHIYFIGEQDEQLFFAMEYIDGESLQDRLDREGSLEPAAAVEYCRMAALGLREAHRHGFTHRDIKPSNVMIDRHGTVKVVDFGIVKKAPEDGDSAITSEGGGLIGTPLYMAPEQAKGEAVDLRADMYALGATLHHLISGQPPFRGDTPLSVVSRHLGEPRPRLDMRGGRRRARAALDELCDRMMAKRPGDRFASYDDLLDAFERVSPDRARSSSAGSPGRSTCSR